jgi:hypothetical protein
LPHHFERSTVASQRTMWFVSGDIRTNPKSPWNRIASAYTVAENGATEADPGSRGLESESGSRRE